MWNLIKKSLTLLPGLKSHFSQLNFSSQSYNPFLNKLEVKIPALAAPYECYDRKKDQRADAAVPKEAGEILVVFFCSCISLVSQHMQSRLNQKQFWSPRGVRRFWPPGVKESITNPAVRTRIANSLHQEGQFRFPALPPQLWPFFELAIWHRKQLRQVSMKYKLNVCKNSNKSRKRGKNVIHNWPLKKIVKSNFRQNLII